MQKEPKHKREDTNIDTVTLVKVTSGETIPSLRLIMRQHTQHVEANYAKTCEHMLLHIKALIEAQHDYS